MSSKRPYSTKYTLQARSSGSRAWPYGSHPATMTYITKYIAQIMYCLSRMIYRKIHRKYCRNLWKGELICPTNVFNILIIYVSCALESAGDIWHDTTMKHPSVSSKQGSVNGSCWTISAPYVTPRTLSLIHFTWYLVPRTWYLTPGTRYQLPGASYLIPGTHLVPVARYQHDTSSCQYHGDQRARPQCSPNALVCRHNNQRGLMADSSVYSCIRRSTGGRRYAE